MKSFTRTQHQGWVIDSVKERLSLVNYSSPLPAKTITYLYQDKEVFTLYFNKTNYTDTDFLGKPKKMQTIKYLDNVIFNYGYKKLKFLESGAKHSSLINVFVSLINQDNFDEEKCRKLAFQYFTPLPDNLDYRLEHGIIISHRDQSSGRIISSLFDILKYEGIHHTFIQPPTRWLRDYILPFGNGTQLINKIELLNTDGKAIAEDIAKANPDHYSTRKWPSEYEIGFGGQCVADASNSEEIEARKYFYDLCGNNSIPHKISKAAIEGGNIIITTIDNKPSAIIGENLLHPNIVYRNKSLINEEHYEAIDDLLESPDKINQEILKARITLASEINIPLERITLLDNYDYHLDIYLHKGPHNIIYMHSDKLTAEIAKFEYETTYSLDAYATMVNANIYEKNAGHILAKNRIALENHGYQVVDVPGIVYTINHDKYGSSYEMRTNFMNAWSGTGKNGYFYITLGSVNKFITEAFVSILRNTGVDNVYLVADEIDAEKLLNLDGSLRCMSCYASTLFGHLGSLYDSNAMPDEIVDIMKTQSESYCSDDGSYQMSPEATKDRSESEENNHITEDEENSTSYYSESSVEEIVIETPCISNNKSALFFHENNEEEFIEEMLTETLGF